MRENTKCCWFSHASLRDFHCAPQQETSGHSAQWELNNHFTFQVCLEEFRKEASQDGGRSFEETHRGASSEKVHPQALE